MPTVTQTDRSVQIVILGAGPGGLFLANRLAHRSSHYQITLYEKRPDPRQVSRSDRAFALGLMKRGREALQTIPGLWDAVVSQGVTVNRSGVYNTKRQRWQMIDRAYPPGEAMVLIQRDRLCGLLLDQLEQLDPEGDRVRIIFQATAQQVNLQQRQVRLLIGAEEDQAIPGATAQIDQGYDLLVGADGVNSVVRQAFLSRSGFDFEQSYFPTVWKALPLGHLPHFENGTSYFVRHHLSPDPEIDRPQANQPQANRPKTTLPRTQTPKTLIGAVLPITSDSHCLLMFWDSQSQPSQESQLSQDNPLGITQAQDWQTRISQWFPNLEITADQAQQLWEMRPSSVVSSQCSRYHDLAGQAVLLGDAAHAMSSRLGQGCQAAFGDVLVLDELLAAADDRLDRVLPQYSDRQVPEGHAVTRLNRDLSPKTKWVAILYGLTSFAQGKLHDVFPQWVPPSLFKAIGKTTIPYHTLAQRVRFWMWLTRVTDPR